MRPLSFTILRLIDDGEFHSGASLGGKIGLSRASISNGLRDLEQYGVRILKIRGRGYRWLNPVKWLDKSQIINHFDKSLEPIHLVLLNSVNSTNSYLINNYGSHLSICNKTPVIATELQTHGRGRLGRQWHSGLGDSLTFSLRWSYKQGPGFLSGLSLVIGIAIIRVLHSFGIKELALKWPNDILYGYRKVAGILIELQGEMQGPTVAVIGIGININLAPNTKHAINQDVSDLFEITGSVVDRNRLLAALLAELQKILSDFNQLGFPVFKNEWIRYHAFEGKSVSLLLPNGLSTQGIVDGVGEDGSLILKTATGRNRFNVGEVSLR